MGVGKRFGRQYRANLEEYQRTAPQRLLRVVFALILAILAGGLLHVAKGFSPLVFNALLALFLGIAAIFLVLKVARILTRTRDETRYIFQGDDDDAPLNEPNLEVTDESIFLAEATTAKPRRAMPIMEARTRPHGGRRLVLGCIVAILGAACLGIALLVCLGWWFLSPGERPMPDRPVLPVEPPPFRFPVEPPPFRPAGPGGIRTLFRSALRAKQATTSPPKANSLPDSSCNPS